MHTIIGNYIFFIIYIYRYTYTNLGVFALINVDQMAKIITAVIYHALLALHREQYTYILHLFESVAYLGFFQGGIFSF